MDFSRYTAWLSRRLEIDQEYPRWLYVEQPAGMSLAGQASERVPSALASLREIVDKPERRFALILGDFGAGKSFLLRELARSLLDGDGSRVPVLVEMRYLEKTLSLRSLLAQHFGAADAGSVDIDAFLYMLREGRVVLLFDGFDELAVRVTRDQVLQHFATITGAAEGKAKVLISSRRQHFHDDGQVKLELARSAEQLQGYRLGRPYRVGVERGLQPGWSVAGLGLPGQVDTSVGRRLGPEPARARWPQSGSTDGTIRLWDVASGRCLAALFSTPEGWVAFIPDDHPGGPPRGAFKLGGDIAGSFWHRIGLARFEPGELDELLPEGKKLRLPDDYAFLPPR